MEFTPTAEAPLGEPPGPPKFDLWMVAALGSLPLEIIGFWFAPWDMRFLGAVFVTGIGIHCLLRRKKGQSFGFASLTGAWLAPAILAVIWAVSPGPRFEDVLSILVWSAIWGLILGFIGAKQLEAVLVLSSRLRQRIKHSAPPPVQTALLHERIDEETTPLEAPPMYGLPRRFGVRGLLIITTWAAVLLGGLRASSAPPWLYFMVIVFVSGALAAQVLLFKGRNPIMASMWTGAYLLPLESLAVGLFFTSPRGIMEIEWLIGVAFLCALGVPGGVLLGAVAGAIGGALYLWADEFLIWLFRGVPAISLAPIEDVDADVLLTWITGPKFCRRWAGEQLTWPLDRRQLLDRFATAQGERPARRIFKAVAARTGNMVGYVELRGIDYIPRRVAVELALVDPNSSERGRLAVRLLRATAAYAFRKLEVVSIMVDTAAERPEVVQCCQAAFMPLMPLYQYHQIRNEFHVATEARRSAESR